MNPKGKFITIEGIEGVGKSTSLSNIQHYLTQMRIPFEVTREPGGTPISEAIRRVLLTHHDETMTIDTELLLFFAGRAQHLSGVIFPSLNEGKYVICDRFTDATYAYQGAGRHVPEERIHILEQWVHPNFNPDLTILFDAPVEIALQRARDRGNPDRFELEKVDFFTRVREAYLKRAERYKERYKIIDASQSAAEVQEQLRQVLNQFVLKHSGQG